MPPPHLLTRAEDIGVDSQVYRAVFGRLSGCPAVARDNLSFGFFRGVVLWRPRGSYGEACMARIEGGLKVHISGFHAWCCGVTWLVPALRVEFGEFRHLGFCPSHPEDECTRWNFNGEEW